MRRNNHGRIQGRRGVALRKARLAREPLCRDCKAKGNYTEAVEQKRTEAALATPAPALTTR
jgi:hypothetical protein